MADFDFQKQAQDFYSQAPSIILGSGASAAFGMSGMWALGNHLKQNVDTNGCDANDLQAWKDFCALLDGGTDLESALHQVKLSATLTEKVISATWELINSEDMEIYYKSLGTPNFFPLGRLLSSMFKSTLKKIDIITTNYDRLAEYACEQEGLHHFSGFTSGYTRRLIDNSLHNGRTVNIWKVHGSLDWYNTPANEICALSNLEKKPNGYTPQIVTPGIEKYLKTHIPPFRDIITNSDNVIRNSNSYLCVGFGFNDEHIQPKLVQKCVRERASITVITRSISQAAKTLLFENKVENYLAIERGVSDNESIIYSSLGKDPVRVNDSFWSLDGYLKLIL